MKRGVYLAAFGAVVVLVMVAASPAWSQATITTDSDGEAQQGFIDHGFQVTSADADLLNAEALPPASGTTQVPRTGQRTCYDVAGEVVTCGAGIGLGQDGDLQLGATWPNPRFVDNGNGTVNDNLTGLIWLKDANCFGTLFWADALANVEALSDGCTDCGGANNDCGLADGSTAGAWRLPNVREMQSLVHYGVVSPAVPNTAGTGKWVEDDPFCGVRGAFYWSSTTHARATHYAWVVSLNGGVVGDGPKTDGHYVWPVRGRR